MDTQIIHFNNTENWLAQVSELATSAKYPLSTRLSLDFEGVRKEDINPMHIVSVACLIELLHNKGYTIALRHIDTNPVANYFWYALKFKEYWAGQQNYVAAQEANISNLWRIIDKEKEAHSNRIHDYLKQRFFQSKDLSAVRNSLDEAYYNIFDHAQAGGNAFSFVEFNKSSQKLYVAVCDFGIGIATLVREALPSLTTDKDAIEKAIEYKFTTGSQKHNMGMGLGNIKDSCTEEDRLIIISNRGKLIANRDKIESFDNTYFFPGSLIYYELSLAHFDDEEIIENFEL